MEMKNLFYVFLSVLFLIFGFTASSYATTYNWTPNPHDLDDLDHSYAYEWGIKWMGVVGQTDLITSATITIENINNWVIEDNDQLFIRLLDTSSPGVTTYYDDVSGASDYFDGQGELLTIYEDNNEVGGHNGLNYSHDGFEEANPSETLVYELNASELGILMGYLEDGLFGFGFDPDCHYFNDGVSLSIETSQEVPEPSSSLFLLGFGLFGLGNVFRKKLYNKS